MRVRLTGADVQFERGTSLVLLDGRAHMLADPERYADFTLAGDLHDVELYLENRRQKGFNAVIVDLIERGYGGPENAEGNAPFPSETDWSPPNDAYFAHADWVIDTAAATAEDKKIAI